MATAPPPHRTREALAFRICTAVRLSRSADAIEAIQMLVDGYGQTLTGYERDLIFRAFNNATSDNKRMIRALADIEQENVLGHQSAEVQHFRDVLEFEMENICTKWIEVIEQSFIPCCTTVAEHVMLLKLIGDLWWYQLSLVRQRNKEQIKETIKHSYEEALSVSQCLVKADPIKLSVQLNLSAFYYDELHDLKRALLLSNQMIAHATPAIRYLDERSRATSKTILQLVQDNMMMWAEDQVVKDEELQPESEEELQPESEDKKQLKSLSEEIDEQKTDIPKIGSGHDDEELQPESEEELQPESEDKKQLKSLSEEIDEQKTDIPKIGSGHDDEVLQSDEEEHQKLLPEPMNEHESGFQMIDSGHVGADGVLDPELAEIQPEPVAVPDTNLEAADAAEAQPQWETPYSKSPPSPVKRCVVPRGPRLLLEAPPDDGPSGGSRKNIRQRMKAAQAKRGCMG